MIGDWVLCVDSTHKNKTYAQIDAIEEGQTCILIRKDNRNWFLDIGLIEAIPLTAEILEKNGLKPHRRYIGMFVERTDKYQLYVNKSNITAYILLEDGAEEHQWILPRPMYVHELQHAVKDFKIKKEIVL